jgi:hypothetical protein
MNSSIPNLLSGDPVLRFMMEHPEYPWANLPSSEEIRVAAAGEPINSSEPFEMVTSNIKRLPRKQRQAVYTRKGRFEEEKERRRLERFLARHPLGPNAAIARLKRELVWAEKERQRRTRKAAARKKKSH